MIPEVGATASFTFTPRFATLNGIYVVQSETTFASALSAGVDFVKHLYVPAGLAQADFNTDYASYAQDKVCVLQSVISASVVYYVPESVFATIPDTTIKEYLPLILVANLGVQENTQAILETINQIKDLIQSSLGSTDPVRVVTNSNNKVYLTDAQYATLVATRQANITALVPLTVQLQNLQAQNTYLAAKVASYEALLAAQGTT